MKVLKRKKRFTTVSSIFIVLSLLISTTPVFASVEPKDVKKESKTAKYVSNEILVKFKPNVSDEKINSITRADDAEVEEEVSEVDVHRIKIPKEKSVKEMVNEYENDPRVEFAEPNYIFNSSIIPNDSYYASYQWNMPKIKAPEGWDVERGESNSVVVAVIDTGVDLSHSDLNDKIVQGYDFANNDNNPSDDNGHGTHVAGIISAETNNGQGVAGVSWGAKIMPVKVLYSSGSGYLSDVIDGIIYAADNGAKVLNLSLGSTYASSSMQTAVDYAYRKGCVIVAAAGNNGNSTTIYPCGCNNVIGVASTDQSDARSSFSNYNSSVDIAAPGSSIASTWWTGQASYAMASGTSMATPHVSGLAALLFSQDPGRTNENVQYTIESGADDLGASGKDIYYGWGRINIQRSLAGSTPIGNFNETCAIPSSDLSTKSYFPWYDNVSPGMRGDWIIIGNPQTSSVQFEVKIGSAVKDSGYISAGKTHITYISAIIGGPVQVNASQPVYATQRVLYSRSFNEIPAIPSSDLSTKSYFPWYDYASPGTNGNWIVIGNPQTSSVQFEVKIEGNVKSSGTIAAGSNKVISLPGTIGGPVEVSTSQPVYATQRVVYNGSFNEIPAAPSSDLSTKSYFPWYDYASPGANGDWIVIANVGTTSANVQIKIGGVTKVSTIVSPGKNRVYTFFRLIDGPVEITSDSPNVVCTQRCIYDIK